MFSFCCFLLFKINVQNVKYFFVRSELRFFLMLPQNPAIAEGLWAATRSYFLKIQWNFTKIGSARSRLYQRIFEFFLRVRWERAFNSQFRKEKRQNSKKKREKNLNENHDFLDFHTLRRTFLAKFLGIFDFLALLSARSRRVLANREERIKKENFSAFFWPVEICEILVRLLIVKVNKLVYIITRRNRLGSGWDFNNF